MNASARQRPQSAVIAPGTGVGWIRLALLLATVLTGLSAGFFFTYEASVTLALADVSDVTYVETFQAVNETVRNPAFGIVFFGSMPALILAIAVNWKSTAPIPRALMTAALPLYLAGLIITGTGNVPLNEDLAAVEVTSPAVAAEARADFEDDWNQLNLLRSLAIGASFAATATTTLLVRSDPQDGGLTSVGQTA